MKDKTTYTQKQLIDDLVELLRDFYSFKNYKKIKLDEFYDWLASLPSNSWGDK